MNYAYAPMVLGGTYHGVDGVVFEIPSIFSFHIGRCIVEVSTRCVLDSNATLVKLIFLPFFAPHIPLRHHGSRTT